MNVVCKIRTTELLITAKVLFAVTVLRTCTCSYINTVICIPGETDMKFNTTETTSQFREAFPVFVCRI